MRNKTVHRNNIRVTILGSGTCVPSLRRSSCSLLMETGEEKMLFDCGPGTMRRLSEAGHGITDITYIFLSHFHPDHSGELASFLFANKYPDGTRRNRKLRLTGGKGIRSFFEKLKNLYGQWIEFPPDLFEIMERDNEADERELSGFTLRTARVVHNPESTAFRIETPAASAVYSGDTDFSENLITLAKDTDLLICECALPDALKVPGHLTPSLAGKIAAESRAKKLLLTHFYPQCDETDIVSQCRKNYTGPLVLAEDLMRLSVG
ncbi:MAG: ribonuclease Z [Desulfococcaceae bacterium]|nr:ribonuclease Z [Desulfococcaceae bacterium]